MMKALVFYLLVLSATTAASATYMITDGRSLAEGLDMFEKSQTGTSVTWPETVKATMAASYAQAFASACVVWETKFPAQTPFNLPAGLTPEQFVKLVQKYLKEHPDRLHERAENLLFDATVAAFPRK